MGTPRVKRLTDVDFLNELRFYDSLTVRELSQAFRRYAKIHDRKDPLTQLDSSKASIKDLFKFLLHEMRRFKYQLTLNITLRKDKINDNSEYASVYFSSFIKTVLNHDFEHSIDSCFEEIIFRIDNWIDEGTGWIVYRINSEYLNMSKYSLLFGSTYVDLPSELNHPKNS